MPTSSMYTDNMALILCIYIFLGFALFFYVYFYFALIDLTFFRFNAFVMCEFYKLSPMLFNKIGHKSVNKLTMNYGQRGKHGLVEKNKY